MNTQTRKLTTLAMFGVLAYLSMVLIRIPIVPAPPLKYEPKDVIIVIGGFIYGPLSCLVLSLIVSLIEMFTVSETGYWGLIANVLATCTFACTAALIYKIKRKLSFVIIGLISGSLLATGSMLLWNYWVVPIYQGWPPATVAAMLVPVFLPYNLLKTALNTGFTLLLYKPVRLALARAGLLPAPSEKKKLNTDVLVAAALIIAACILLIVAWRL